jgi:NDP-sugar pyrophosphorylase family protein
MAGTTLTARTGGTGKGAPAPLTVCVLAGGRGTRLGEATRQKPKGLIEVAGQPFLVHQLRLLAGYGVSRAVLCVGYLGEMIEERIGPSCHGVEIAYSYDSPGLDGTLGAIRRASALLGGRFLVLYGDTFLRVNYADVAARWEASGLPAAMTVLRNENLWDASNAVLEAGRVTRYNKVHPTPEMAWVDYGLGGLTAPAIDLAGAGVTELSELYATLAERDLLFGYEATERFYEIGRAGSLAETDEFVRRFWAEPG